MTTTNKTVAGWKSMTAAQLLQLAAALRASAATAPAFMRRGLLLRAALREKAAAARV